MGVLGRKITAVIISAAIIFSTLTLPVQAEENLALRYEKPEGGYYLLTPMQTEQYEIQPGDSLWKIARRLWGDGRLWTELYERNRSEITDRNLIFPGQVLQADRPLYLKKQDGYGVQSGAYHFDMPGAYRVGVLSGEEAWANFVLFAGSSDYNGANVNDIACLVREKEPGKTLDDAADCEAWEKAVSDYAKKEFGDRVRDLKFERYFTENGNPVCLYSYTQIIDLWSDEAAARGESQLYASIQVCVGMTQSEHMQADFVGFDMSGRVSDIRDRVRYVTASFADLVPEGESGRVNEENMQISPDVPWEPVSFNAFAWVDSYFYDLLWELTGYKEEQKSRKEKLLDRMKEGKGM